MAPGNCGNALQGRDSGTFQPRNLPAQESSSVLSLELHATHSAFRATEDKEKGRLLMESCRWPGGGAGCSWRAAGGREEGKGQKGCVQGSQGKCNESRLCKREASPEPEGSRRRTALAFSRWKEIAKLCKRRSVSAAGVSLEHPATRPTTASQTTAAVGPSPTTSLSAEQDKLKGLRLTEALGVEVGALARLVCCNSSGTGAGRRRKHGTGTKPEGDWQSPACVELES